MKIIKNEEHYKIIVEENLEKASKLIWIASANLKDMQVEKCNKRFISIVDFLNEKAKQGVQVRVLYGGQKSTPFMNSLKSTPLHKNFNIKKCIRNHFKTVVVDSSFMYLGSANLTGAGMGAKGDNRRNFEAGIVSSDCNEIDEVMSLFNIIWEGEECSKCGRKKYCRDS